MCPSVLYHKRQRIKAELSVLNLQLDWLYSAYRCFIQDCRSYLDIWHGNAIPTIIGKGNNILQRLWSCITWIKFRETLEWQRWRCLISRQDKSENWKSSLLSNSGVSIHLRDFNSYFDSAHRCSDSLSTTILCYLGNIDDQNRNSNTNNRDHLVEQL